MTGAALLVVDVAIVVALVELAVLALMPRVFGGARRPPGLLANVAAGLFLMLGIRAALQDAPWTWIAASLAAAGVAHVVDLTARWPRRRDP